MHVFFYPVSVKLEHFARNQFQQSKDFIVRPRMQIKIKPECFECRPKILSFNLFAVRYCKANHYN